MWDRVCKLNMTRPPSQKAASLARACVVRYVLRDSDRKSGIQDLRTGLGFNVDCTILCYSIRTSHNKYSVWYMHVNLGFKDNILHKKRSNEATEFDICVIYLLPGKSIIAFQTALQSKSLGDASESLAW